MRPNEVALKVEIRFVAKLATYNLFPVEFNAVQQASLMPDAVVTL